MGVVNVAEEVCNIALGKLGVRDTVLNIDDPDTPLEKIFAKVYHSIRQLALKEQKPNFAIRRRTVAENSAVSVTPSDAYAYEYPADCLALLGVGEQEEKENTYWVEGYSGGLVIYSKEDFTTDGMDIRYIHDVSDVSIFSAEFVLVFAAMLADRTSYEITEDDTKKQIISADKKAEKASAASLNAQENRPIKINNSKFMAAKKVGLGVKNYEKG